MRRSLPFALLVLAAGVFVWIWFVTDTIRQMRIIASIATTGVTLFLLLLWLAFLSHLPRSIRLGVPLGVVAAIAAGSAVFRIKGVTGDFVPILALRRAHPAVPPSAPPLPSATSRPAPEKILPSPATETAGPPSSTRELAPSAVSSASTPAPDFPQFLGPARDGILTGVRLGRDWSARPPRQVWRKSVGEAWSGFAVAGGVTVTQEQHGPQEWVVAYDLATGAVLWSHADNARFDTVVAGVGPRATPTIAEGRVFTMGATGILNALDLATGRRLWSQQVVESNGASLPEWGKSTSPLSVGKRVVVSAGGPAGRSLVAYRAETGELAWAAGNDRSGYGSPQVLTLLGRPQIVIFNQGSIAGHDPETGMMLWEHGWPAQQPNVAPAVALADDRILFSSGYGIGSKAFHLAALPDGRYQADLVWESPRLKSKFANMVLHREFVYGLDDGVMTCIDPTSGERRWKGGRYGHGQLLLAGDLLLVQTEEGEVVLLDPSPEASREVARFTALSGKTWNPPALAGSRLVVRNDREAAVYELPSAN
jgi:outer membrane protein assembly factor BamB